MSFILIIYFLGYLIIIIILCVDIVYGYFEATTWTILGL